jgi:soluble lytic murein transglycosylase-like protein
MQLMPETASRYGVRDPHSPAQNLRAGVEHLRFLLARFGGNVPLAVAAYNAGKGAIEAHGGIPPYAETRRYVRRVLAYRRAYRGRGGVRPVAKRVFRP